MSQVGGGGYSTRQCTVPNIYTSSPLSSSSGVGVDGHDWESDDDVARASICLLFLFSTYPRNAWLWRMRGIDGTDLLSRALLLCAWTEIGWSSYAGLLKLGLRWQH